MANYIASETPLVQILPCLPYRNPGFMHIWTRWNFKHGDKFCLQCNKNNKKKYHIKTKEKAHTQNENQPTRKTKNVPGHTAVLITHLSWTK